MPALTENFDGSNDFPPAGWNVTDHSATARCGSSTTPRAGRTTTGGSGNFADINSDFYGGATLRTPSLVTPKLDLSSASAPFLTFHNNYIASPYFPQIGDVDVSTDGGATWTNVWHHGGDAVPGPTWRRFSFRRPPPGQREGALPLHGDVRLLVDGRRRHAPEERDVRRDPRRPRRGQRLRRSTPGQGSTAPRSQSDDKPADNGTTFATPDDPNNPDGFYFLFSSLTGSHPFTASKAAVLALDQDGQRRGRRDGAAGLPAGRRTPGGLADVDHEVAGARKHDDRQRLVQERRHRARPTSS